MILSSASLLLVFVAPLVRRAQRRNRARISLADHHEQLQERAYFGAIRDAGEATT